ncbi:MAG: DUF4138 domain-containing protein, partial [Cyclobacteriaceae bacterium]
RSTELLPSYTLRQTGREAKYDTIPVGYSTSVNLIFDSPVKQWDMGLGIRIEGGEQVWDVLVENSPESPKRIKLAAGIQGFKTTNLFVETTTAYYNFILKYEDRPGKLLYQIQLDQAEIIKVDRNQKSEISSENSKSDHHKPFIPNTETASRLDSIDYFSQKVLKREDSFNPIGKSSQQILFFLSGIYIRKDHLFFKLYIRNDSNIPFDIGFIGFFKSDRGRRGSKKRPIQEEHLTPVFINDEETKTLESKGEILKVFVFRKFTLSKRKRLYIQVWEGDQGERKIELSLKNKDILKATTLATESVKANNPNSEEDQ